MNDPGAGRGVDSGAGRGVDTSRSKSLLPKTPVNSPALGLESGVLRISGTTTGVLGDAGCSKGLRKKLVNSPAPPAVELGLDGLGWEELGLKDGELGGSVSRNIGARGVLSVTGGALAAGLAPGLNDW